MSILDDELERLTERCIGCGGCRETCPSLKHGGCDPAALMRGDRSGLSLCIGCGNCSKTCRNTDPARAIQDMVAIARGLVPSRAYEETGYCMPASPGSSDVPSPGWTGGDILLMPGCIVKCKAPFIENAAADALSAMGFGVSEIPGSACCLHPTMFRSLGQDAIDGERRAMGANAGGKPIVALCGGCSEELGTAGVAADHLIRFLYDHRDRLPVSDVPLTVALEPGCAVSHLLPELEEIVRRMGFRILGNRTGCCGKGIALAPEMMAENERDCEGADVIAVGCPMCFLRYDSQPDGIPVMHIAELAAFAAGRGGYMDRHTIRMPALRYAARQESGDLAHPMRRRMRPLLRTRAGRPMLICARTIGEPWRRTTGSERWPTGRGSCASRCRPSS